MKTPKKYSKEAKERAIRLSDEIGIRDASKQLGYPYETVKSWRKSRSRKGLFTSESVYTFPLTEREKNLLNENIELRKLNELLQDVIRTLIANQKQ